MNGSFVSLRDVELTKKQGNEYGEDGICEERNA